MSLLRILKYNPYHDELGRFTTGPKARLIVTSDIEVAARALASNKRVSLRQVREVSTLLNKLAEISRDAIAKGEKAPNYNLCAVSVKGTNLFCHGNKNIPRVEMPQLKGFPVEGSKAKKLIKPDERGEYDVTPYFRKYLEEKGAKITDATEGAAYLRATQNELNGGKTAAIANAIRENKLADERIFVSRDNYIVDGHHRWSASVGVDTDDGVLGDITMKVARVDMGIIELLGEAKRFADEWGIPQVSAADKVKKDSGCCDSCVNLSTVFKYNPYHDERGRFTSKGKARTVAPRVRQGVDFVSPNKGTDMTFGAASDRLRSQEQSLLSRYSAKVNSALGINGTTSNVVGAWADGAENSTVSTFGGEVSYEAIKAAASMKGLLEKQKSVIAFKARRGGQARMSYLDLPGDMEVHHRAMLNAGLEFHTLQPTENGVRAWVFQDKSNSETNAKLMAYGKPFGRAPNTWAGDGEFVGSWTSRKEGAAAYRKVLSDYVRKHPETKERLEDVMKDWKRRSGR